MLFLHLFLLSRTLPFSHTSCSAQVPTVGTNFKNSLVSLMATLNATHPHYIRCIKPNSLKIPSTFDADMVLAQLRYAGMLETIRIRRLGYPIRYPFNDFFRRYNVINPFVKARHFS